MFQKKLNILLITTLVSTLATFAHATFPGKNGRIVFVEGVDIWTMNPDGSDARNLTSFGTSGEAACCAAWSGDGRQLVFTHVDSDTSPAQVWMMDADGSRRHQVLKDPKFWDDDPSFSPDGTTIVFERCPFSDGQFTGGCELFHMRVAGTGLTTLIPFGPNTDIFDVTPAYSPDGKTIAFAGFFRAGLISAVYLMNSDGSHIRPISPPGLEAFQPNWSPDGSLAFSTRSSYPPNTLTPQVWIMNKDGSGLRQFTFPGASHDFWPSWSPEGNAITFERDNADFTQFGIFVKNTASNNSTEELLRHASGSAIIKPQPLHRRMGGNMRMRRNALFGAGARLIEENAFLPRWGPAAQ